jgi:hypothetical protein
VDEQENMHDPPGDFVTDEPLPLGASEPVDVVQVRADDALIAALISTDDLQIDDPIDERLVGLLRSWREDVHAEPERPLVDLATATAALASAQRAPRRRQNPFGPLATAAAVLVIAFIGLGLAARGAEPGDPLWGVTKVLYTEKAKSIEAAVTVRTKLDQASKALESGNVPAAMTALQEAKQKLPVVAAEDGRQELQELATQTEQLIDLSTPNTPPPTTPTTSSATTSTTSADTSTPAPQPPPQPSTTSTAPPTTTTQPEPTTTTSTTPPPTTTTAPAGAATEGTPESSPKAAAAAEPPLDSGGPPAPTSTG